MIRTHRVLPVSLLLACAWPALAADVAGMVKTSVGKINKKQLREVQSA